jgi:hypothetical protein
MADQQPIHPVLDNQTPPSNTNGSHTNVNSSKNVKKHLRPFIQAVMAFKNDHSFEAKPSIQRTRRLSEAVQKEGHFAAALTVSTILILMYSSIRFNFNRLSMLVSLQYSMTPTKQSLRLPFMTQFTFLITPYKPSNLTRTMAKT